MATYKFEELTVWQKAHALVLYIYQITKHFPEEERFALVDQFRRAAVSIEANIAEGYKKVSRADKLRFYNIAEGSLEECRDYHILARDLNYIDKAEFETLHNCIEETSRLLISYSKAVRDNVAVQDSFV